MLRWLSDAGSRLVRVRRDNVNCLCAVILSSGVEAGFSPTCVGGHRRDALAGFPPRHGWQRLVAEFSGQGTEQRVASEVGLCGTRQAALAYQLNVLVTYVIR